MKFTAVFYFQSTAVVKFGYEFESASYYDDINYCSNKMFSLYDGGDYS